ncbi:MAG: ABC transporter permease subunit [Halapricum sp.]
MSWQAVAKKDFQDAIRSRMFWALSIIFGLLAVGVGGAYGYFDVFKNAGATNQGVALVWFVSIPVSLFVTLTAVIISHKAIVGERESGSIKILLALPHSRLDVVLGKIVGRTGVLAVPTVVSLVLGVIVGSALIGSFAIVPLIALLCMMVVLIVAYVSLMIGMSAFTNSTSLATAGAVGYFIVFELLWSGIGQVILMVMGKNPIRPPDWYYLYTNLSLGNAFNTVLGQIIQWLADTSGTGIQTGLSYGNAFYVTPWVAVVSILLWLIVPAAIGYKRFSNTDL